MSMYIRQFRRQKKEERKKNKESKKLNSGRRNLICRIIYEGCRPDYGMSTMFEGLNETWRKYYQLAAHARVEREQPMPSKSRDIKGNPVLSAKGRPLKLKA